MAAGELTPQEIARMIDLSCVRADSTEGEMREAVALAVKHVCAAVFALPAHTPLVAELLSGRPDVVTGGVVGFPDGGATTSGKVAEAEELLRMGCGELDMVIDIAWLKAGRHELLLRDIASVVGAADGAPVKIILECHYLTDEEIVTACRTGVEAGVAFVKTGTGWAPTGATRENVALMKRTVGDRCGIKAAGGVRDLETLLALHELGATRFGIGVRTARDILER
ncbi:MAG: deoxyribose-phosphate aldolase [Planctomycetota bacterium]|jgi:deoxyribose-phosphate aldolase